MGMNIHSPAKKYSFGLGKDQMQPLHVDHVYNLAKRNVLAPSPDKYDLPRTFGNSGLNKSFGGPDNYENVRLKR